jgi:NAD(P)H-dependent flavin oxidoreductase YrpB (nitropropane dioxygenase family)
LTTIESDLEESVKQKLLGATSRDTVRSRCLTGKPIRQLRTPWVAAWEAPDAPPALPSPLQGMLVRDTLTAIFDHNVEAVMGTAVGQVVGTMKQTKSVKTVMFDLVEGFIAGAGNLMTVVEDGDAP